MIGFVIINTDLEIAIAYPLYGRESIYTIIQDEHKFERNRFDYEINVTHQKPVAYLVELDTGFQFLTKRQYIEENLNVFIIGEF